MEKLIEKEMQKRSEIVNNFHTNYLLEAGAGAGKTSIIVERVINHIINEEIDPGNIVAITFTKAASLELAERIQRKALEHLSKEEYAFAKSKLERVEEIFTGTIHSFCELILREMPFEAGLTPGYEIVEDSQKFYDHIWYEFLREFEEDYKNQIEELNRFNIDYRELKKAAFVAMDNPDIDFVGFQTKIEYKDIEEKFQSLSTANLNPSFIKTGSNIGKLCISMIEDKKDLEEYISTILVEFSKIDKEDDLKTKFIFKKNIESEGSKEIISFIEDLLDIYDNLNSIIYNISTEFVNKLVDYKEKAYRNSLTFNDLLFTASSLIKKSPKARSHFKNKFKYFYIDEAQDTDPMQAELLLLLSHEGHINELKSLEDVSPRDGSLFIVGDPKQSIYRFRRADITIYESVKRIIASRGQVVYLDINFRSTDSICKWVEDSFKDREDGFAFSENATKVQAGFEKILSLWKVDKKAIERENNKLSGVYGYEFSRKGDIKEEEYVAAFVEEILKNRTIDVKTARADIKTRRIENKDIMILTKSNEETGRYLNALKNRNIPVLLAGEKTLGHTREVLNLFLLIDSLIDFGDRIKLVAALRNCFYLDFETIDLILENEDLENLVFNEENIKTIKHPHLKRVFFSLRNMMMDSQDLRPLIFTELLIKNKIGIYDLYKEYSEIEKRDADSSLFQTLEILKSKQPVSLYGIREELKTIIEEKVNYELPIDLVFAQNSVRIMNIHKSKGLEAEIVILVGIDKTRWLGGDSHYVEKKGNKTLGYLVYNKKISAKGPQEDVRKDKEKLFKNAELDRLIYVAATRTKSVLITPSTEADNAFLYPLSKGELQILDDPHISDLVLGEKLNPRKMEELEITHRLMVKRDISQPSYRKMSPSSLDTFKEETINLQLLKDKKSPRGKIYGDIVHRAFELVLKNRLTWEEPSEDSIDYAIELSLKEYLDDLDLDGFILKGLYPQANFNLEEVKDQKLIKIQLKEYLNKNLKATINSFLKNKDIRDLLLKAKNIFTEFPFTSPIDSFKVNKKSIGKKVIANGYIDLLIQGQDDSFSIIDYKTDIISEADSKDIFEDRYINQLEIYKDIIEERLKDKAFKVDKLLIYSTYLEKVIFLK